MAIIVLDLREDNELISLSETKQLSLTGGGFYGGEVHTSNGQYQASLNAYASGSANISSNGNVVTFTSTDPETVLFSNYPGEYVDSPGAASFLVKGDMVDRFYPPVRYENA